MPGGADFLIQELIAVTIAFFFRQRNFQCDAVRECLYGKIAPFAEHADANRRVHLFGFQTGKGQFQDFKPFLLLIFEGFRVEVDRNQNFVAETEAADAVAFVGEVELRDADDAVVGGKFFGTKNIGQRLQRLAVGRQGGSGEKALAVTVGFRIVGTAESEEKELVTVDILPIVGQAPVEHIRINLRDRVIIAVEDDFSLPYADAGLPFSAALRRR